MFYSIEKQITLVLRILFKTQKMTNRTSLTKSDKLKRNKLQLRKPRLIMIKSNCVVQMLQVDIATLQKDIASLQQEVNSLKPQNELQRMITRLQIENDSIRGVIAEIRGGLEREIDLR